MKFLFDFTHPKQCMFFPPIIKELQKRKHEVLISAREFGRDKGFMSKLLKENGIDLPIYTTGGHGKTKLEKLENFAHRTLHLANFMNYQEIEALICLSSPSAVRAAYGLGKKIFVFNDIPEAEHTAKLTIPFSDYLFFPFCIPSEHMNRFGPRNFYKYPALDPIVWIKNFMPNDECLEQFDLVENTYIIAKHTPTAASFNEGKEDLIVNLVNWLTDEIGIRVLVHSYDIASAQVTMPKAEILEGIVDLQSLMYYSKLLVTGGGTTSIEAAYFGRDVISARPILTHYDKYLILHDLMFRSRDLDVLKKTCQNRLFNPPHPIKKNPLHDMEFPLKKIVDIMEDY